MDFSGEVKVVKTLGGDYHARAVIIATGASPRTLGFPGEEEFTGRGVAYCSTCDGEFFEGLEVFVIGAGYAAAEEAIFLDTVLLQKSQSSPVNQASRVPRPLLIK